MHNIFPHIILLSIILFVRSFFMKKKTLYFSILSLISLLLLLTLHLNNTYSEFNSSNVRNNIYVLSSNTLGGRLAGSTENEIAAEIIKNRFINCGLKSLNNDGTYTQTFNTVCPVITNSSDRKSVV